TTFDMLLTVVRDGTGDEEESLTDALRALSSAKEAVLRREGNQNSALLEIVYGLCESTGSTIESILEERRGVGEGWSIPASLDQDESMDGMPPLFAAQDDQPCSSSSLQLFSDAPVKDDKPNAGLHSARAEEQSAFSIPRESAMATSGPVDYYDIDIKDEPFDDWSQPLNQPMSYLDSQLNRTEERQKQQPQRMTLEQLLPKKPEDEDDTPSRNRPRSTRGIMPSKDYDFVSTWNGDFRTAIAPTPGVWYPCSQCPKKFPSMKSLRGHEHKHNGIMCTSCHQHVKKQNYADHIAQFCKRLMKPPTKTLNLKGTFKKEEAGVTPIKSESKGGGAEKFYCAECGKKCHNKFHLEYHMRTHTGERPYACPYCDTSLRSLSVRNSHIRSVHQMQPYACLTCSKQFERMSGLRQHLVLNDGHEAASERNDGAGALADLLATPQMKHELNGVPSTL
ncbi:hypothetical protein PMAYCL1PPCAC_04351, partial [Pristionchus mayeri]